MIYLFMSLKSASQVSTVMAAIRPAPALTVVSVTPSTAAALALLVSMAMPANKVALC